jgi:fructokinase
MPETKNSHRVVCFGETLWDFLPTGKEAGGAPMNVAYHLRQLGMYPALISRIGLDEEGKQLIEVLESKHICTDYFQLDYEAPTGKVIAEFNSDREASYTILKGVAWDNIQWEDSLPALVSNADYFIFGSLAARSRTSCETLLQLISLARTKVLDINLRQPFFDRQIVERLISHADILKLNLSELELITGWFSPLKNETDRIRILKDRFGLPTVILTKGKDGAVLNIGEEFYHHAGYEVKVADTVGSGDAFLAAIIRQLIDRSPPEQTLEFACRLGAFVATRKGACPAYSQNDLETHFSNQE